MEISYPDFKIIMKELFENDLSLLLENLKVDEKLHIKGLEKFEKTIDGETI